jgi:hypothetical protein
MEEQLIQMWVDWTSGMGDVLNARSVGSIVLLWLAGMRVMVKLFPRS